MGAAGALAQADPRYVQREVQLQLALAVAAAIDAREALVAEAGTGVGKTYAYLAPALLSGKRTLVSTATKSLQDQLFLRDIPRLRQALNVPVSTALLKGRGSYLCTHRLNLARQTAELPDRWAVRTLAKIEQWATSTRSGDLAELEGLDERSSVIPLVTSTRENCLGTECPQYQGCHVVKARREAMAADVVVVNHHLFFADMALRDTGVAELLPTVEVAIFDEAHQLSDAGVQFLGSTLGTAQLLDFARDMLALGLQQARGLQPWQVLSQRCEQTARELRLVCAGRLGDVRGAIKLRWDERCNLPEFAQRLEALGDAARAAQLALQAVVDVSVDFVKLAERAQTLAHLTEQFMQPAAAGQVRWI
ncbi:MAG: ATP-dependent DNA helicase, partial [Burkholderiaceae bacterium]